MKNKKITRRNFLASSAAAVAGCTMLQGQRGINIVSKGPGEKVNVAPIGCGGMGAHDTVQVERNGARIAALCDVDRQNAAQAFEEWYPDVPHYTDFREMLDKQDDIDAVTITIPDHSHTAAALYAMERGKHVYVQKPLTTTIAEARALLRASRMYGVATQMGNQGHSEEGARVLCEMIRAGMIGDVSEVHCWTNRPIWPQGMKELLPEQPVPDHLDWDLWIGTAPMRPYNEGYCPFVWRGWWDFGTGSLGDMGCHILDPSFWALHLGSPDAVECLEQSGNTKFSGPIRSIIKYEFPARKWKGDMLPPVTLHWYDGDFTPTFPDHLDPETLGDDDQCGTLFVGSKGYLTCDTYGENPRLVPNDGGNRPDQTIPRVGNVYTDWLNAITTGRPACSNFEYSVPLTEMVLLGNIALRTGKRIEWNSRRMRVTNLPQANRYVSRTYREGWA